MSEQNNARQLAVKVLRAVVGDGQSLTEALAVFLPNIPLSQRGFVQALCYGVCRDYQRLQFLSEQILAKPLRKKDLDIQLLLLTGLFQLRSMRVKPHAAVAETVAAVGRKSWAKAVVNAVLRNYLREQEALEAIADKSWCSKYSHPDWLIDRLKQDWGAQTEAILQANNQPGPMSLRVNSGRINREDYLALLAAENIPAERLSVVDSGIVLTHAVAVEQLPGFAEGLVSVQDGAAQLAAVLLDARPGDAVLDMCAAPGGKTAAILERQPDIRLLALDISEKRLTKVQENLTRLKLQAECQSVDVSQAGDWCRQAFDRILLDAPCSAVGVIRRHPDIKLLRRPSDIEALAETQQHMLELAWQALKPGGVLLYATCSVFKRENEQQLVSFLAKHADATEWPIEVEWGVAQQLGRQLLPGQHTMDGFYYARLQKRR